MKRLVLLSRFYQQCSRYCLFDFRMLVNIASFSFSLVDLVNYTRPVIIFGPFKDILNDQLLTDHPDRFANCVPRMFMRSVLLTEPKETDRQRCHVL